VTECFQITGRGAVVVIDGKTELPVSRPLQASVTRSDGSVETFCAWKEWLLRRVSPLLRDEAFLLVGADVQRIPIGSLIELREGE
jgi:hypothetical protein